MIVQNGLSWDMEYSLLGCDSNKRIYNLLLEEAKKIPQLHLHQINLFEYIEQEKVIKRAIRSLFETAQKKHKIRQNTDSAVELVEKTKLRARKRRVSN